MLCSFFGGLKLSEYSFIPESIFFLASPLFWRRGKIKFLLIASFSSLETAWSNIWLLLHSCSLCPRQSGRRMLLAVFLFGFFNLLGFCVWARPVHLAQRPQFNVEHKSTTLQRRNAPIRQYRESFESGNFSLVHHALKSCMLQFFKLRLQKWQRALSTRRYFNKGAIWQAHFAPPAILSLVWDVITFR